MGFKAFSHKFLLCSIILVITVLAIELGNCSKEDNSLEYKPLTDKEKIAIKEFREKLSPHLYQSYMRLDQYLIRWIRDSNYDLGAAQAKLLKAIKWRKENNIDSILKEDFSKFERQCPYKIKGNDQIGRPLLTLGLGTCDIRKMTIAGELDRFERFITYLLERAANTVREIVKSGSDVRDGIIIADMNGFNLRQHGCVRCLPAMFSMLQYYESYYPDYLHKVFFINVPRIALPFVDILLPVASDKLRSVLKVYGFDRNEWQTEIRKYIEPDQIPYQFGGNKE